MKFKDHVVVTKAVAEARLADFDPADIDKPCPGSGELVHRHMRLDTELAVCPACKRYQEIEF